MNDLEILRDRLRKIADYESFSERELNKDPNNYTQGYRVAMHNISILLDEMIQKQDENTTTYTSTKGTRIVYHT
jgi:hypothetical protein